MNPLNDGKERLKNQGGGKGTLKGLETGQNGVEPNAHKEELAESDEEIEGRNGAGGKKSASTEDGN